MSSKSTKKKKRKISKGNRENLTSIINNLSFIIGRKSILTDDPRATITSAYDEIDPYIAGLALNIPEVDTLWSETGARDAFLKLKRKRKTLVRLLFGVTIAITIVLVAAVLVSFILMEHWSKWLILVSAVGMVMFGTLVLPNSVIGPYIVKKDQEVPSKYPKECNQIDSYIKELLKIRK